MSKKNTVNTSCNIQVGMSQTHKCVENIEVMPKLELYENSRVLIRRVSKARYSWEVVVFYVSITIS